MFNVLRHMFPTGRAWVMTVDNNLRKYFKGVGDSLQEFRLHIDKIHDDLLPLSTRAIEEHEEQLGLPYLNLSDVQRRKRIAGGYAASGGQSPQYIQDILQASGYDVYVHDSWIPGTEPSVGQPGSPTYRNPNDYLTGGAAINSRIDAGELFAEAGEPLAEAGDTFISPPPPIGYMLVNKIPTDVGYIDYSIPTDPALFPHIIYIGGRTFGQFAAIDVQQKDELERLLLKLRPTHLWIGVMVSYV